MRRIPKEVEKESLEAWAKKARRRFPKKKGWICRHEKGYPDLVYFNKNTQELVLVEVKSGSHGFHAHQKEMIYMLVKGKQRKGLLVTYDGQKITKVEDALKSPHDGHWEGVEDRGVLKD